MTLDKNSLLETALRILESDDGAFGRYSNEARKVDVLRAREYIRLANSLPDPAPIQDTP